jgi:hypothetical protein
MYQSNEIRVTGCRPVQSPVQQTILGQLITARQQGQCPECRRSAGDWEACSLHTQLVLLSPHLLGCQDRVQA